MRHNTRFSVHMQEDKKQNKTKQNKKTNETKKKKQQNI